jgi:hypothetical protein
LNLWAWNFYKKEGRVIWLPGSTPFQKTGANKSLAPFLPDHDKTIYGRGGEYHLLREGLSTFQKNGETKGELICLAQLISTIAQTGIHLFPVRSLIQNAESLLGSSERGAYPYERATLWNFIGYAYLLVEGDIRKGIQICENAYLISKEIRDIPLQARALLSCTLGFICVGRVSSRRGSLQKNRSSFRKIGLPQRTKNDCRNGQLSSGRFSG